MFFVLKPSHEEAFKRIRDEAVLHRDVVVTSHADETYLNCTYAVLDMFRTIAHIGTATHLLKTDEDCYVRVDELLHALQALPVTWLYAGNPIGRDKFSRTSDAPRFVPFSNWPASMAPNDDTPVYAWGYAAVLTMDFVQQIAAGVPHIMMPPNNLLRVEDVATGVWVEYVVKHNGVNVTYSSKVPLHPSICDNALAVVHLSSQHARHKVPAVMNCMFNNQHKCC
jgi:hypothetical protein